MLLSVWRPPLNGNSAYFHYGAPMSTRIIFLCSISSIFIGWVCGGYDDGPVTPPITEIMLNYSSFEKESRFSMDGWSIAESALSGLVDSSYDTPFNGSRHALKLRRDTVTNEVPGVTKTLISSLADTAKYYSVTMYAKGKGTLLVQQRTEDGPKSTTFYLERTMWWYYTLTTVKARPGKDTLTFTFRPLNIDPVSYLLIDNVQITYWRKN